MTDTNFFACNHPWDRKYVVNGRGIVCLDCDPGWLVVRCESEGRPGVRCHKYRVRMWFAVIHSLIAVPLWAWLYAVKGVWIWGAFVVIHTVILGVAATLLLHDRGER